MSSAAMIWLLLLHLFSPTREHAAARGAADTGRSRPVGAYASVEPTRAQNSAPEESIRASARVAAATGLRQSWPLPFGGRVGSGLSAAAARLLHLGTAARQVLEAHRTDRHRIASRGAVLPYFPTAPPAQAW